MIKKNIEWIIKTNKSKMFLIDFPVFKKTIKEVKIKELKELGIPIFFAIGNHGTGKTYFFEMIKESLEKKNKKVLYLYGDKFSIPYVKEKIKKDNIEVILLDESEVVK